MEEKSQLAPNPECAFPLRWSVVLYSMGALLGFEGGLGCFDRWGREGMQRLGVPYDSDWWWAWGAAVALAVCAALAVLKRERPHFIASIFGGIARDTAGGWPWQAGRGWWFAFVLLVPVAFVPALYAIRYQYDSWLAYPLSVAMVFGSLTLANYFRCTFWAILAAYGLALGRSWTPWIGIALLATYAIFLHESQSFALRYADSLYEPLIESSTLALTLLKLRTGSLLACVLLHAAFNYVASFPAY